LSRIDFPRFNDENVNQWIYQCENYFLIDQTPEEFKVQLTLVHLQGKALQWHITLMNSDLDMDAPSWPGFTKSLKDRFGAIGDDPMVALMRLRQKTSVDAYHEEFDSIITRLKLANDHILSCFLGGLKQDIQMIVRMFESTSLQHAFTLAKTYEAASFSKSTTKFHRGVLGPVPVPLSSSAPINVVHKPKPTCHLTSEFIAECTTQGLCYFCDEPYSMEHSRVLKKLQLHVMEIEEEDDAQDSPPSDATDLLQWKEPQISVNALTGLAGFRTMRITGYHQKRPLHILIDSGSTHNFLDTQMAEKYGCIIETIAPLNVVVVDGSKIKISFVVKYFSWTIQHTTFTADMLLLPFGCCDLVLGIEWLITLDDILWNFDKLTMEFNVQGRRHVLRGSMAPKLKPTHKQQFSKAFIDSVPFIYDSRWCRGGHVLQFLTTPAAQQEIPTEIANLLQEFADVFQEPQQLPPFRPGHDHHIPLIQGVNPVNKRPYRYATTQKDIIDQLIHDYLQSKII